MVFIIITTKLHTSCNSHPHLHRFVLMFSFLPSSSKVTAAVKTRLVGSRELLKTDAPCKLQQMILQVLKTAQNIQTNTDGTTYFSADMNDTPSCEPAVSLRKNCGDTLLAVDMIPIGHQHDAALHHKLYTLGRVSKRQLVNDERNGQLHRTVSMQRRTNAATSCYIMS